MKLCSPQLSVRMECQRERDFIVLFASRRRDAQLVAFFCNLIIKQDNHIFNLSRGIWFIKIIAKEKTPNKLCFPQKMLDGCQELRLGSALAVRTVMPRNRQWHGSASQLTCKLRAQQETFHHIGAENSGWIMSRFGLSFISVTGGWNTAPNLWLINRQIEIFICQAAAVSG